MTSEETQQANAALAEYKLMMKEARIRVNALSKKGLARVLMAGLEFPLSADTPSFRESFEKELFYLTLKVNSAKNNMIKYFNKQNEETAAKLTEAEAAKGEESNVVTVD